MEVIGTHEINERFGIPRHRVMRFKRRGLWPEPLASLNMGDVWKLADVERAIKRLRRDGKL